jgi:TonB family protein
MKLAFWFFLLTVTPCWSVQTSGPAESKPPAKEPLVGYVFCPDSQSERSAPMLLDICGKLPAGRIKCGQQLSVVQRRAEWLELVFPDKVARYLPSNQVSRSSEKFIPFEADSGISDGGAIDCPIPPEPPRVRPARPIYTPDPIYSDKARKMKISGTVQLSLVLGIDGVPRDVKIEKGLGYGLDENAVEAVRRWKFQPAMKDGQPIETKLYVTTTFRLY